MMMAQPPHVPVLIEPLLRLVAPVAGTWLDGTFGAGGYARALLLAGAGRVIGVDRDPRALAEARDWAEAEGIELVEGRFGALDRIAEEAGALPLSGVVLDIGVSSMQLDTAERGFSFMHDGPLDMRMSAEGMSAADFVNSADEEAIANVIYTLGEERRSRAIARAIVKARAETPFTRTRQLADVVSRVFHGRKVDGRHPATRTFQALRIYVNDELGELAKALSAAERILKPGGRLVVVTFHSLEDRIVKRFLTARAGKEPSVSRHLPVQSLKSIQPSFRIVNSRPLTPSQGELDLNPRARSARLRAAVRTDGAAWPLDLNAIEVPQPEL
jgi:16S rRNA (cytosine1402-N4)-methyltransferase